MLRVYLDLLEADQRFHGAPRRLTLAERQIKATQRATKQRACAKEARLSHGGVQRKVKG